MNDLPSNLDADELEASETINDSSGLQLTDSISGTTTNSTTNIFGISDETVRISLIALAVSVFVVCLFTCISIGICICIKRRRRSKHKEKKDHLLPESSVKGSFRKSSKTLTNNASLNNNGKQSTSMQPVSTNSAVTTAGTGAPTAGKSFYYDNLDDIPFIDESRPTSVIDITQV